MGDIHIDDFFKDAGIALNRLYASFPRPVTLFVEDISGPITTDEFGVPATRSAACLATLLWLAEESYLRYADTIRAEAIDQAVLTGPCFAVLSATTGEIPTDASDPLPTSVRAERGSRISALRVALKSGNSIRVRAVMTAIMAAMNH